MNLRLFALKIYIPALIKKKKLEELFTLVADAFGEAGPPLRGLSYKERLNAFAKFTMRQVEKHSQKGQNLEGTKRRLFENSYRLGQKVRNDFNIRNTKEIIQISRILYQILGIEFKGTLSGDITIKKCFFSSYYSSQVCQVISSLDEGVAAGLSEGGKLSFYQRITEGKECCKAHFTVSEGKT
ncbi:MAG: hypothetical protein OEY18_16470 [Candidatus Aminicenantes bacterium]|nr:hypothetical protein [Candidatus Aminicenantes bacterium]MDH5386296.1 hypothetical protein [Candidatus Aminicenantes bacterium]MDH5744446.1 hypothetical protein [Candidatus Aminicenantes bacterium]